MFIGFESEMSDSNAVCLNTWFPTVALFWNVVKYLGKDVVGGGGWLLIQMVGFSHSHLPISLALFCLIFIRWVTVMLHGDKTAEGLFWLMISELLIHVSGSSSMCLMLEEQHSSGRQGHVEKEAVFDLWNSRREEGEEAIRLSITSRNGYPVSSK